MEQKINLNGDAAGTKNNKDIYELFEEIDTTFVDSGVKKSASMEHFELLEKNLDPIYANRIKKILKNVQIIKFSK